MYRDHVKGQTTREDREREKEWTNTHLVSYTWVQDEFLPNPERYPIR